MDEIDARITSALRPLTQILAQTLGELDKMEPGFIDRLEAITDHPSRELRGGDERAIDHKALTILRLARQWGAVRGPASP